MFQRAQFVTSFRPRLWIIFFSEISLLSLDLVKIFLKNFRVNLKNLYSFTLELSVSFGELYFVTELAGIFEKFFGKFSKHVKFLSFFLHLCRNPKKFFLICATS